MEKDIFLLLIAAFFKRISWFENIYLRKSKMLADNYGIELSLGKFRIQRINAIKLDCLTIRIVKFGIVLTAEDVLVGFGYRTLLVKKKIGKLCVKKVVFSFHQQSHKSSSPSLTPTISKKSNSFCWVYRVINKLFHLIPDEVQLEHIDISIAHVDKIGLDRCSFNLKNNAFSFLISNSIEEQISSLVLKGLIDKENKRFTIRSFINEVDEANGKVAPFYYKQLCSIQKMHLLVVVNVSSDAEIQVNLDFNASGLKINHPKVALNKVSIQSLLINASFVIRENEFTINETSFVKFNFIESAIYFKSALKEGDRTLKMGMTIEEISPDNILKSLPFVANKELLSIKATGSLAFRIMLALNLSDKRYHYFSPEFIKEDFRVLDIGKLDLNYLNYPFRHKIYDDGTLIKEVFLDSASPAFVNLASINKNLIDTVICTEDPNFYRHKGIDKAGVALALVTNIREKKVLRGASTITMQLARNLFLGHSKSVTRKLEELIFAWLMDEVFKIPKERILEIYLNIIEFAPGIYGISDACKFYFDKEPDKLTLLECLVLSYIIPRPKFFVEAVTLNSPTLIKNLKQHIRIYSNSLFRRRQITESELVNISHEIKFSNNIGHLLLS